MRGSDADGCPFRHTVCRGQADRGTHNRTTKPWSNGGRMPPEDVTGIQSCSITARSADRNDGLTRHASTIASPNRTLSPTQHRGERTGRNHNAVARRGHTDPRGERFPLEGRTEVSVANVCMKSQHGLSHSLDFGSRLPAVIRLPPQLSSRSAIGTSVKLTCPPQAHRLLRDHCPQQPHTDISPQISGWPGEIGTHPYFLAHAAVRPPNTTNLGALSAPRPSNLHSHNQYKGRF